jgi:hypothetical protein
MSSIRFMADRFMADAFVPNANELTFIQWRMMGTMVG